MLFTSNFFFYFLSWMRFRYSTSCFLTLFPLFSFLFSLFLIFFVFLTLLVLTLCSFLPYNINFFILFSFYCDDSLLFCHFRSFFIRFNSLSIYLTFLVIASLLFFWFTAVLSFLLLNYLFECLTVFHIQIFHSYFDVLFVSSVLC
jgi:hypothetical protein